MKYSGRDYLLGGLFLALSLVIPVIFHALGLGPAFLPMFFPIILSGFMVSLPVALSVGILAPVTSMFLTGMPPVYPPIVFIMMIEGLVLAGIPAVLYQKYKWKVFPVLFMTMIGDRLVLFWCILIIMKWLKLPGEILGLAFVLRGIPGIVLIFIVIPPLVWSLEKKIKSMPVLE